MAGFDNDVVYGTNVDFTGGSPVTGQMTANGQLLIGASVAPFLRANTLTAGTGISITNGAGTITITNTGGGGGGSGANTLSGNSGSATESGGVINVIGATGITTTGAGQTLTLTPTDNLLALFNLATTGYMVRTGVSTFATRTFLAGSGITLTNASGVAGATTITADANVPTTFTSDAGVATPAANNLNVLGGTGIDTTGAGSTLTVTFDVTEVATIATSYACDAGSAVPAANVLTVTGGTGCATSGAGSTVTINVDAAVPLSFPTDSGTATPAGNALTVAGGTGCATTGAGATVTVNLDATVPLSFPADTGTATPAGNALTIAGGTGCSTTGVGSTITVNVDTNVPITFAADVGSATPAANTITMSGGTGIATTGAGSTVTFNLDGPVALTYTTDSGVAVPSSNNLNIIGVAAQGIATSGAGSSVTVTATNATNVSKGVASFDAGDFTVVNGAVSLNATGVGQTITGDTGGALSPTAGNWNILGGTNIDTSGSGSTLTVAVSAPFAATTLTQNSLILGNGTSNVSALGAATDGQLPIGDTGGPPILATLTAGSGISIANGAGSITITNTASFNPSANVQIFDDFIGTESGASAAQLLTGQLSWFSSANNPWIGPASIQESGHPGVLGSQTGGNVNLFLGDIATTLTPMMVLGGGVTTLTWIFKIQTLSTASPRYILRLGFGDTGLADQANGCYFEYSDNINSGNWVIKTAAASSRTTTNSATAVTAAWHKAVIVVNAAASSVSFTMDGVSLGSIVATIPTAAVTPFLDMDTTVGSPASSTIRIDLMSLEINLTSAR